MPTYVVTGAPGRLSASQKSDSVKAISRIHSQEGGGVPEYLVQVFFNEISPENHFINKRTVTADEMWIRGDIRPGRSDAQKTAIAERMMKGCAEVCGLDPSYVWVYICEADKTVEFGSVLPAPGGEKAWEEALPREVGERYGLYR